MQVIIIASAIIIIKKCNIIAMLWAIVISCYNLQLCVLVLLFSNTAVIKIVIYQYSYFV